MSRKWLMWGACGLMVVGGIYLLWARGNQNILGYVMLLVCPLSHLLMMGSHGHGGHDHSTDKASEKGAQGKPACH